MKRLAELTKEDLLDCPVWEYYGDDDKTASVSPAHGAVLSEEIPEARCQQIYVALTEYTLANGDMHLGYCSPIDPCGLDYIQPVMLIEGVHIRLYDEDIEGLPEDWTRLGIKFSEVFPLSWRCCVPVDGETVHGTVPE
ncbi:hypothetical protein PVT68_18225 [Microbulbifer bruguierae]|uniref:Uncharacterized protein n=1 Tax=Microbulbifer bruguierae TaxID=3029061 RepID=A0ABY8ND93_9GAMM|nr:hypothetical protein [Microbulbifer bruguierae]WGL16675.1 hypothetical protein PVT68_18225 [Microbulbifer bruguierae]